jgi:hypothetical protein
LTFIFPFIGIIFTIMYIVKQDARRAMGYILFTLIFGCCWYILIMSYFRNVFSLSR